MAPFVPMLSQKNDCAVTAQQEKRKRRLDEVRHRKEQPPPIIANLAPKKGRMPQGIVFSDCLYAGPEFPIRLQQVGRKTVSRPNNQAECGGAREQPHWTVSGNPQRSPATTLAPPSQNDNAEEARWKEHQRGKLCRDSQRHRSAESRAAPAVWPLQPQHEREQCCGRPRGQRHVR